MQPQTTLPAQFASRILAASDWSLRLRVPPGLERCVVIGAPHTSNWDFVLTMLVGAQVDLDFRWLGKQTLFRPPFGAVMRALGGVSVDRSSRQNIVEQLADKLRAAERMALVIAPEGTRSRQTYWKSGFYHIARQSDAPLVLGYVDYERREAGLGPMIDPVGPVEVVMDTVREFYDDKTGRFPDQFTEPKLRLEENEER